MRVPAFRRGSGLQSLPQERIDSGTLKEFSPWKLRCPLTRSDRLQAYRRSEIPSSGVMGYIIAGQCSESS